MQKYFLGVFLLLTGYIMAQKTYTLSAAVTDAAGQAVAVGDVQLISGDKKTLFAYTSLLDGHFSFEQIPQGPYLLRLSCLGFKQADQILELERNLFLKIQLEEAPTALSEVEVRAAKPVLSLKNGHVVLDVTNPILSTLSDPMELLSKLPTVQLSIDREALTILGKGTPLIYMGNQQITLEEFRAIPVADIQTIEIITNPSARYEAAGRAVILVTRKANRAEGLRGNLSEMLSFRQNVNNYLNANTSYSRNNLTYKANMGYNALQTWESHRFEFGIPAREAFTDYTVLVDKNNRVQVNYGVGLFWQLNETDYLSLNGSLRTQGDAFTIETDTYLRQGSSEDRIATLTGNDNSKDFGSVNLNFNKGLLPRITLFTGLQYTSFSQKLNTRVSNNYNNAGFEPDQRRRQSYLIHVLASRLDLEKAFENDWKLELGTSFSEARANAFSEVIRYPASDIEVIDNNYQENTFASYAQVSGNLSQKISLQSGIRIESNEVLSKSINDLSPIINRNSNTLFPKLSLHMEIDSSKSLTAAYSKNITRPDYSRASTISAFINPFLEGTGNPNLRPSVIEEISTNFQFGTNALYVGYSWTKNPMYFTIGYDSVREIALLSLNNLDREAGWNISLTLPKTKGIWTSTNVLSFLTRSIEDPAATTASATPYFYLYTNHQFLVAKDITLSIGGWAITKRSEGIFRRNGQMALDAAISKTFFDHFDCALRFNNFTGMRNFAERYAIDGVQAQGVYFGEGQEIALSLKYNFGSAEESEYRNREIDENLERIR